MRAVSAVRHLFAAITCVCIASVLASESERPLRFLFVGTEGTPSHFLGALEYCEELQSRGHNVTFVVPRVSNRLEYRNLMVL